MAVSQVIEQNQFCETTQDRRLGTILYGQNSAIKSDYLKNMNPQKRDRFLTFFGSVLATLFWGLIFEALDVSSPKQPSTFLAPIATSVIIGGFFVIVDRVLNSMHREQLIWVVLDVAKTSVVGSLILLTIFFVFLAASGVIEFRHINFEITSGLFLAGLLACSNFALIFTLKTTAYFIDKNKHTNG